MKFKILAPLVLFCQLSFGQGLSVNWDLELKYDTITDVYTVYGTPDTTVNYPTGSNQITVLLPDASYADVAINATSLSMGLWQDGGQFFAGPNGMEYHAFQNLPNGGVGGIIPITKNVPKALFSFTLPGTCVFGPRLIREASEVYLFPGATTPTVVVPADPGDPGDGGDYYHTVYAGGSINNTNGYDVNINNYGDICSKFFAPLNTQFQSLNVKAENCQTIINWESLSEDNITEYIIYRSTNGSSFTQVGETIAAKGAGKYSVKDYTPATGINYYKIEIHEKDGTKSTSAVVSVSFSCNGQFTASMFPNPVSDVFEFNFQGSTSDENTVLKVQVLDAIGKVVLENQAIIKNSHINMKIDASALAAGNYLLRYHNDVKNLNGIIKFTKVK